MPDRPLDVLILWHMHQPLYQNLRTGRMVMPWVRLHGAKDYLDMVMLLEEFPDVHLNMNWVPSLLDQIIEYAEGRARDTELDLSQANPETLDAAGRIELLKTHFAANERRMIERHPRYAELRRKRGNPDSPATWNRSLQRFTTQDLRDLQVWMNLSWIDPLIRQIDPVLSSLLRKGRNFTEDEKLQLLDRQRDILAKIIPTTATAWKAGRIEVSVSPYYHPILPLLCDTSFARRARPQMPLPQHRFSHPEDAQAQIIEALDRAEALFGMRPRGMWPSEGSICDEIIPMMSQAGLQWMASDEEVLAMSIGIGGFSRDKDGNVIHADRMYRAWQRTCGNGNMAIVFRDHVISDLIGFQFANWSAEAAADALIQRLEYSATQLSKSREAHAVSIILDGENCWEYYEEDGLPFLRAFYRRLSESPLLRSVTISQHLQEAGRLSELTALHSGSWINHDYGVWIGHAEDNKSWDLLCETRQAWERRLREPDLPDAESLALARKSLMIAEGSDWNWWYGDEHNSGNDEAFDQLYREHLSNVYRFLGLDPPAKLAQPIISTHVELGYIEPRAFILPNIDGRATSYFEWFDAGRFDPAHTGGAMRQTSKSPLGRFFFGFDLEKLYLRVDLANRRKWTEDPVPNCTILIFGDRNWRIETSGAPDAWTAMLHSETASGEWQEEGPVEEIQAIATLEIAIAFDRMGLQVGDSIGLQVEIEESAGNPDRQPPHAPILLTIPDIDFEARMWVV